MPSCVASDQVITCNCSVCMPESQTIAIEVDDAETCDNCNSVMDACECEICPRCDEAADEMQDCCGRCAECCTYLGNCSNCRGCGPTQNSTCENCELCTDCCECVQCPECDVYYLNSDACSRCHTCNECGCHCDDNENRFLKAGKDFHTAKINQHKTNKSQRFISAEIEVARVDNHPAYEEVRNVCKKWGAGIVSDGSLPSTGFEINTAPASGDLFVQQIQDICSALSVAKAKVTNDCGLHVHVDARNYSYWEVRRLIKLYALIEPALFKCVPSSRLESDYCKPCATKYIRELESGFSPKQCKDKIFKTVYLDESKSDVRTNKYKNARYNALNIHSWFYRGTIECRLAAGTVIAEKIYNWGMLWADILDWAYKHTEKDIKLLQENNRNNSWKMLQAVITHESVTKWLVQRYDSFNAIDSRNDE